MEDKLHDFFSENEFDFHEPYPRRIQRFEKHLQSAQPSKRTSWGWMSVATSVVLILGFYLGYKTEWYSGKCF